jgi:glucose/arabinose dehydrogenase
MGSSLKTRRICSFLPAKMSFQRLFGNDIAKRSLMRWRYLLGLLLCGLLPISLAQTDLRGALSEEPIHRFGLVDALPGVEFAHPVVITSPFDSTNSLYVAERAGSIYAVTNLASPNKTLFLKLSADTAAHGGLESGLLGMAFHPQFASNGYFFVYRTVLSRNAEPSGYYNRLSRFKVEAGEPFLARASTEEIILQQRDNAFHYHNAGDIHFGPDGYLYLSLGDSEPPVADFRLTRQPIDKNFFGVILRIDVDKRPGNLEPNPHPGVSDHYLVPQDNPFVNTTEYQGVQLEGGKVRTEIFALGFRNPWRFCFDPISGEMIAGDVGEHYYEEVNVVRAGANYGWPYLEALLTTSHHASRPPAFSSEPPLWSYLHDSTRFGGQAIVGGKVYTGSALPGMARAFIFGDNVRGHVWALFRNEIHGTNEVRWLTGEPGLSTFGIDPRDGEILMASLITGRIRKLVFRDPEQSPFPRLLSQTGLFTDTKNLQPTAGVVPYEVNVPFWSDYAEKRRWFSLPQNGSFGFDASNHWALPSGTIWIKQFDLDLTRGDPQTRRRISTRLLVKTESSVYGVTYKWNAAGTDAELVDGAGDTEALTITDEHGFQRPQDWNFPSRLECKLCHSPQAGYALAFNTEQLNCPDPQTGENQIEAFARQGVLSGLTVSSPELPALASATNKSFSTEYRVRSYLQANCAQCHRPGNPIITRWDARFHTPIHEKELLNTQVIPNSLEASLLHTRLAYPGLLRMPPISTSELDLEGLQLVRDWIAGMPAPPWVGADIGTPREKGNGLVNSKTIEVAGYAGSNGSEAGHYLYVPGRGSVQIIARLSDRKLSQSSSQAGIRLVSHRETPRAYFAGVNSNTLISQLDGSTRTHQTAGDAAGPIWLRLTAEGGWLKLFQRTGSEWNSVEAIRFSAGLNMDAGLSVTTANTANEQFARFEDVSILFGNLLLVEGQTNQATPAKASIQCVIDGQNFTVERVEFAANGQPIGERVSAPYLLNWSTNAPGSYQLTARIITEGGSALTTLPVTIHVESPPAQAWLHGQDSASGGDWKRRYGSLGYAMPDFTNWPAADRLSFSNAVIQMFDSELDSTAFLMAPNGNVRTKSYWTGTEPAFSVEFPDRLLHKITLYFADPLGTLGEQRITIRDFHSRDVILEQDVPNHTNGVYLSFLVNGKIEVLLSGDPEAAMLAVFLDPSPFPAPILQLPPIPTEIMGSSILSIKLTHDTELKSLEVFLDGALARTMTNPPGEIILTNLIPGYHTLTLRATDTHGQVTETTNIPVRVLLPPSTAKFLGTDNLSKGAWMNGYGKEGYLIVQGATNLPPYTEIKPTNHFVYGLLASAANPAPLVLPQGGRATACWTASFQFSFDVSLGDGLPKQVSLYAFDEPNIFRDQIVRVVDPATGRVLSVKVIELFEAGRYYQWSIQGNVRFEIIGRTLGTLINAVFFDQLAAPPPSVSIVSPNSGASFPVPSRVTAQIGAAGPANSIQRTELYLDNILLADYAGLRESADLPRVLEGNHWLSVAGVDRYGRRAWSSPVLLSGEVPEASVEFQREDTGTLGSWKNSLGKEGFMIAGDSTNFPPLADFSIEADQLWFWTGDTLDESALERAGAGRVAAAWNSSSDREVTLNLSLPDGEFHGIALYFLDYLSDVRSLRIDVRDSRVGTLLDTREISDFGRGKYLVWRMRGNVTIQVVSLYESPVLSGVFIDSGHTYHDWLDYDLSGLEGNQSTAPAADPDGDGIPNLIEFLTNSNPMRGDELWNYRYEPETREVVFEVALGRNRAGVQPVIEVTGDLRNWLPADVSEITPVVRLNSTQRILEYSIPVGQLHPMFFRLGAIETDF